MNIQRAAEATGLSADTIRFYERRGVLPRPPRRENGYRDYTEDHLATLHLVGGLRHLGLSLADMQMIAQVSHDATCGDLRATLIERLGGVLVETEQRIHELEHTCEHVEGLLDGLRSMRASQRRVPGTNPCRCVQLVGAGDEEVGHTR
jgi:DNA-binding transcriptional MerR regulator